MKSLKILCFALLLALSGIAMPTNAQNSSSTSQNADAIQDFHIDKDGNVQISQAKVMQISGTTFYIRYYVGLAYIRILVKTTPNTKIYRRFGDEIPMSRIASGDIINIEGKVENGADSLSIIVNKMTDFSDQNEITGFKGTIVAIDSSGQKLNLSAQNKGNITIALSTTTQIKKGTRIISSNLVHPGDRVTDTVGTFDHATNTLYANVVIIYTDMKIYAERNFQGELKAISGGNPQTLTVTTEGKDYSVILTSNTSIMNNKRKNVSLQRFVIGDTIRIYGNIRETEEPIIDAQIVRNISL